MIREPVISSNLSSVGYNSMSQTLEIEFNSGRVYQYSNVPSHVYSALMSANSHGQHFSRNIRNNYHFTKIV